MKRALLSLVVLLLGLAWLSPMQAAVKYAARPNSNDRQDLSTLKKRENQRFLKRVWQTVFPKMQLRQKPSPREARLGLGGGALIAVSLATIAVFISGFWALAIIAWAASLVLGVIGLFKDERKAMAIVALSLALVLPIMVVVLQAITCCGP